MAIKETVQIMRTLLLDLSKDLEKAYLGNKTAAQRVRVNTILLEKAGKLFRKESIASEKKSLKSAKRRTNKKKKNTSNLKSG